MSLTLYYHPLASFCHKVLVALYENAIEFERRVINLADDADRAELQAIWPIGKFPVIRDHARKRDLAETTIIIEYLDRFFAGERPLIPSGWEDALDIVADAFVKAEARDGSEAVWPYYYAGTMGLVQRDGINRLRHVMGYSRQHSTICSTVCAVNSRQPSGESVNPRATTA